MQALDMPLIWSLNVRNIEKALRTCRSFGSLGFERVSICYRHVALFELAARQLLSRFAARQKAPVFVKGV